MLGSQTIKTIGLEAKQSHLEIPFLAHTMTDLCYSEGTSFWQTVRVRDLSGENKRQKDAEDVDVRLFNFEF